MNGCDWEFAAMRTVLLWDLDDGSSMGGCDRSRGA